MIAPTRYIASNDPNFIELISDIGSIKDKNLYIDIRVNRTFSPVDHGNSEDSRKLGVGLRYIKFE